MAWADNSKYTPPMPAPPSSKADKSAPRDYNWPIPSRMEIPGNYECEDEDNEKFETFEKGGIVVEEFG